jgi:predicted DCC family thiol-disulfide oxidoreductase YuxK
MQAPICGGFKAMSTSSGKHIVLYDSECPLCTFQMRVLSWLDWTNCLALVPLSDPLAQQAAPSIEREDLQSAIHCITTGGKIYRGARCIRFVGMRLPLLVPVALFLWIPGVIQIAEVIYQWVSRNRLLLSRVFGCKDACAILPKRSRAQDKVS